MAKKPKNAHEEYAQQIEQAKKDTATVVESTEEMIDMPMFEYAKFLDKRNIGELKAFRVLMQMHLDRADLYGKKLVEEKVTQFGKEERIALGSVFSVVSKIVDRMGYIDYLIQSKSIK
jgi:hypothetical protein